MLFFPRKSRFFVQYYKEMNRPLNKENVSDKS